MNRSHGDVPTSVLLLAAGFGAQYRVLRTAAALPARVHVLGAGDARALARSRFCSSYASFHFETVQDAPTVGAQIDEHAQRHGAKLILAGDALTARLLVKTRSHLRTPCYPLPDLDAFDALATKDRFAALCRTLGIRHPRSKVFGNCGELLASIGAGEFSFPTVLKPLNRAGGIGVVYIDAITASDVAARIGYAPILAQDFISGEDRSITVFCRDGRVLRQATYSHPGGCFRFFREPALEQVVSDIARAMNLTGIFNFDARVDGFGRVWMLECNPRFFFNIDVAMLAGMNFISLPKELPAERETLEGATVHIPPALLARLMRGRLPTAADRRMLGHWLRDPLVLLLLALGYQGKWKASWLSQDALPAQHELFGYLTTSRATTN